MAIAQSPTDRASAWLVNAWTTVKKQGKSAADRVVRESPAKFKDIKKQVQSVTRICAKGIDSLDLDGKKRVVEQLWRVRSSLNLLALANPNTLTYVGVDPDQVTGLLSTVNTSWASVAKRYPDIVKSIRA